MSQYLCTFMYETFITIYCLYPILQRHRGEWYVCKARKSHSNKKIIKRLLLLAFIYKFSKSVCQIIIITNKFFLYCGILHSTVIHSSEWKGIKAAEKFGVFASPNGNNLFVWVRFHLWPITADAVLSLNAALSEENFSCEVQLDMLKYVIIET